MNPRITAITIGASELASRSIRKMVQLPTIRAVQVWLAPMVAAAPITAKANGHRNELTSRRRGRRGRAAFRLRKTKIRHTKADKCPRFHSRRRMIVYRASTSVVTAAEISANPWTDHPRTGRAFTTNPQRLLWGCTIQPRNHNEFAAVPTQRVPYCAAEKTSSRRRSTTASPSPPQRALPGNPARGTIAPSQLERSTAHHLLEPGRSLRSQKMPLRARV